MSVQAARADGAEAQLQDRIVENAALHERATELSAQVASAPLPRNTAAAWETPVCALVVHGW